MIFSHSIIDYNEIVMIVSLDDSNWYNMYPDDHYTIQYKRQDGDKVVIHLVKKGYKYPRIKSNPFKRTRKR